MRAVAADVGVSIYALIDPETKQICYVGSSVNPRGRLLEHRRNKKRNFELKILEQTKQRFRRIREQFWIRYYFRLGLQLLNQTLGGEGGYPGRTVSEEVKQKISDRMKGRLFSDQHRANLSKAMTGKKLSKHTKSKISASRKGIPKLPEHKAKISAAQKGKSKPWLAGKPLSEEHKAAISQGHMSKSLSFEHRKAISQGHCTHGKRQQAIYQS